MPEPGSEADEAVRDARQAVYRVDQGRQLACQQVTPMSDDLNLEAALDAYAAVIRASERAKLEALIPQLERALGIIENGAEMVGPDVYEFTKDEVIDEAASAIRAALDAVRRARGHRSQMDSLAQPECV